MTITLEWLNRYRTERYGFTRIQVESLGLTWPPKKGWLRSQVGREISDERARLFDDGRFLSAKLEPLSPKEQRVYDRECACWVTLPNKVQPPPK